MAQFDLGGVLGAVLGGATHGTARRRPGRRSSQADLGRLLGTLAGVAIEAMTKAQAPAPAPQRPPPRSGKAAMDGGRKSAPPMRGSVPATGPGPGPRETWSPVPGGPDAGPLLSAEDREGVLMLRAMIAAAKADGQVDEAERARIAEQLAASGVSAAARDAVLAEFGREATPGALAREAADPMLAAQLYAAAVAGAGHVEGAERAWLDGFAKALRLDRAATEAIERRILGG